MKKGRSYLKIIVPLAFLLIISASTRGQNPVCPPGVYIADPSARVWDNMLYLYGSTDQDCDYYCSWHHDIMYTSDLIKWNIAEKVFASKGENDEVKYNDNLLFAPDCMKSKGQYYLYYCQPGMQAEGLAVADNPLGPFTKGRELNTGDYRQIDPAVFVDDDGSAYYLWGQFSLKIAKLKDNIPEDILFKIKEADYQQHEKNILENSFWDSVASESELSGSSLDWISSFREMTESITTEELEEAARKYFNTDSFIDVTLYPESYKDKIGQNQ